jgi:hypothetical protein
MSDHLSSVMRALEHAASGDFARAQHCLESESDSEVVGARYAELTKTLYARNKDVHGMIALGRAGIDYQLRQAKRVAADDAALSVGLRKEAKRLAFNVAANCWPGWGDDGVVIEAAHIEEGLRLAKLSLGLVQELALEQRQLGNAFWLVGALDLAAGRTETAMASFDRAHACFLSDGERLEVLLAEGYQAIALSATTAGERADVRLDEVVGQLQQDGSEKAEFFARQLRTAARTLRDRLRHG